MLGHEHIGPDSDIVLQASSVDRFDQPETCSFSFKKLKIAIARERQFMRMAGIMEITTMHTFG